MCSPFLSTIFNKSEGFLYSGKLRISDRPSEGTANTLMNCRLPDMLVLVLFFHADMNGQLLHNNTIKCPK